MRNREKMSPRSARGSGQPRELARRTELSRTTVASIVADLQQEDLVVEREDDGGASPRGGRPPRLLSFSRSAGAAIGIDFGKRHLAGGGRPQPRDPRRGRARAPH